MKDGLHRTALPLDFVVLRRGRGGLETQAFIGGQPVATPKAGPRIVLHQDADSVLPDWQAAGALCLPAHRVFELLSPEEDRPGDDNALDLGLRYVRVACDLPPEGETLRLAAAALPATDAPLAMCLRRSLGQLALETLAGTRGRARGRKRDRSPGGPPTGPFHTPETSERPPHQLLDDLFEHLQKANRPDEALPFETRRGQIEMAHAVLDTLLEPGTLVVEAGAGVGKTLAYLLPALLLVARTGARFLVSTHTRNLQEQLASRDLPELWRTFGLGSVARPDGEGHGLRFAKLVGRAQYLCRTSLRRHAEDAARTGGDFRVAQLLLWSIRSTGELEEIAQRPGFDTGFLRDFASRREVCRGKTCRTSEVPCPVYRARETSRRADLVVVNHALLFSDGLSEGNILGDSDGVLLDECHHLERVAAEHLAVRLGRSQVETFTGPRAHLETEAQNLTQDTLAVTKLQTRLLRYAEQLHEQVRDLLGLVAALEEGLPRLRAPSKRQRYRDGDLVFGPVRDVLGDVLSGLQGNIETGQALVVECGDLVSDVEKSLDLSNALELVIRLLIETRAALVFLAAANDEDWAYALEFETGGRRLRDLVAWPLSVADPLQRLLWTPGRATVSTSATLTVGDEFDYFLNRVGLASQTRTLVVRSPFDYPAQCLAVQAQHLDGYAGPDYVSQVTDILSELVVRTGRRTLVLLTSHQAVRALHAGLTRRLGTRVPILAQEISGSRGRIAARFASSPGALLLGTSSFWEGVDFPGSKLEVLAIAKLPFLVPDEPLVEARCERLRAEGEDPFRSYLLPDAVLRFQQGFGRLIRTRQDRGAVLFFDTRLGERGYGSLFLRSLPVRPEVFHDSKQLVDRVATWLGTPSDPGSEPNPEP